MTSYLAPFFIMDTELSLEFYILYSGISLGLVLFAGAMSGLTIGLLSLSDLELQMKIDSGTFEEQEYAQKIAPVISDHHLILVTLLLANAVAMETLPLFISEMVPSWAAVLISTTFVLIFGEVLPQAILTGPNQLRLGSRLIPLVKTIRFVLFPVAWPIAQLLDRVLGHKLPTRYDDVDLKALISIHVRNEIDHIKEEGCLFKTQVNIIHGAIDLHNEVVRDYITSLYEVQCISDEAVLDAQLLNHLMNISYSRLPVYAKSPHNIVGILQVKKLIAVNPELQLKLKDANLKLMKPLKVRTSDNLLDLLLKFSKGSHFAVVQDELNEHKTVGIITLEDVIERLLKKEIIDENDMDRFTHELSLRALGIIHKRPVGLKRYFSEYNVDGELIIDQIRSLTTNDGYVKLGN